MKKVTRYLCEWCGKEFKTPDRHRCRWSPEAHNCLSCKHRGKSHKEDSIGAETYSEWVAFDCPFFDDPCEAPCDFAKGAVSTKGNGCQHWELIEGYEGKTTFAKTESERKGELGNPYEENRPEEIDNLRSDIRNPFDINHGDFQF